MDMQSVLYLAAAGGGLYFLVQYLFNADTRTEDRRRRAIQLSSWASSNGLPILGRLLEAYAVGDYSGAVSGLQDVGKILSDSDQSKDVVDRFLKVQLGKQLATAEGRKDFVAYIEKQFGVELPKDIVESVNKQLEVKKGVEV